MKKISWRVLSLLLSVLFTVSLLMLPASAGEEFEEQVVPDEISEKMEVLFDYMQSFVGSESSDLDEFGEQEVPVEVQEAMEEFLVYLAEFSALDADEVGIAPHGASTCTHPGAKTMYTTYIENPSNPDNTHLRVVFTQISCKICGNSTNGVPSLESHIYPYGKQFVSSNHNGPYSGHTLTYQSTCVCGHVKTETVPADCGPVGCVNPCSLEPSELDS